jgi:hypothetical protein
VQIIIFNDFQNKIEAMKQNHPDGKKVSAADKREMYVDACEMVLSPVVESVRPLHPPKVWEDISPNFIVTFWSLTSFDLSVPTDAYEREIDKLKQLAQTQSSSRESRNKREVEKTHAMIDRLKDELKKQNEHVENVIARLKKVCLSLVCWELMMTWGFVLFRKRIAGSCLDPPSLQRMRPLLSSCSCVCFPDVRSLPQTLCTALNLWRPSTASRLSTSQLFSAMIG